MLLYSLCELIIVKIIETNATQYMSVHQLCESQSLSLHLRNKPQLTGKSMQFCICRKVGLTRVGPYCLHQYDVFQLSLTSLPASLFMFLEALYTLSKISYKAFDQIIFIWTCLNWCWQEFCFFALFGLGSDVFLQMFFFTTVLSIDIRRMEVSFIIFHHFHHYPNQLA